MPPVSSNQNSIYAATPSWNAGGSFSNITASLDTLVKAGNGVLQGLTINTVGTTSTATFYDGYSAVATITIATPGVVTITDPILIAELVPGSAIIFSTTGALPTGLTAGTAVYVSSASFVAGTFQVADTKAHALAGTNSINTSGSQSGVQTAWDVSNKIGKFSTVAQNSLPIGAQFTNGLIAITADGGGAADITVLYR